MPFHQAVLELDALEASPCILCGAETVAVAGDPALCDDCVTEPYVPLIGDRVQQGCACDPYNGPCSLCLAECRAIEEMVPAVVEDGADWDPFAE